MSGAILITGAASGIGRATVDAVLAAGWKVVALDLPGPFLDALQTEFDQSQVRCAPVDVTYEDAVAAEIAFVEAEFAPLTGAVNSAEIAKGLSMMQVGITKFRRILDVKVIGSFIVGRQCARVMRGRGGAIVNIGSVSGSKAMSGTSPITTLAG